MDSFAKIECCCEPALPMKQAEKQQKNKKMKCPINISP